jgi:signal transduction histidine kinase
MADRTQMLQLFQNLIGNGIKYNESEQPRIEIRHEYRPDALVITIADNGIGIPEEYREKAFQIFKRLPTERKYEGSGIGLAICRRIVEGMNGNISIHANTPHGTVFRIVLPREEQG